MEFTNKSNNLKVLFDSYKKLIFEIESFNGNDSDVCQEQRFNDAGKIADSIAALPIISILCCAIKIEFVKFFHTYEAHSDNPGNVALNSVSEYLNTYN